MTLRRKQYGNWYSTKKKKTYREPSRYVLTEFPKLHAAIDDNFSLIFTRFGNIIGHAEKEWDMPSLQTITFRGSRGSAPMVITQGRTADARCRRWLARSMRTNRTCRWRTDRTTRAECIYSRDRSFDSFRVFYFFFPSLLPSHYQYISLSIDDRARFRKRFETPIRRCRERTSTATQFCEMKTRWRPSLLMSPSLFLLLLSPLLLADGAEDCPMNLTEAVPAGARLVGDVLYAGQPERPYGPSAYRYVQDGDYVLCTCAATKPCVRKCCKWNSVYVVQANGQNKCSSLNGSVPETAIGDFAVSAPGHGPTSDSGSLPGD